MTNREKREKLNQYREAEAEGTRLQQEISRWYSKSEKMTTSVQLVPISGGSERRIESAVAAIEELAGQLGVLRKETVQLRKEVGQAIDMVSDGKLRRLLRHRYIDGMTWEAIAVEMGLSYQWVCALHGRALERVFET